MIRDESAVVLYTLGPQCSMRIESRHLQLQCGEWTELGGLEGMGWETDLESVTGQQRSSGFR